MHFFIGCYTNMISPTFGGAGKGIYSAVIDDSGAIKLLHTMPSENPAYVTLSNDNHFLYAITETIENAVIKAFKINADYSLTFLNKQTIKGGLPCHIAYCNANLIVSCYGSGNVLQFPVNDNGQILTSLTHHKHSGSSLNKIRQEAPHAHQAVLHSDGKTVYVPDLGIDRVKVYEFNGALLYPKPTLDIITQPGAGCRHIVFNSSGLLAYLIHELTGEVTVLEFKSNQWQTIVIYPSLPNSYTGLPSASAIRLHPNGQFLYVANRGFDGITIFKIQANMLVLVDCFQTQGQELREFNITPNGQFLIACHQNSNDTITYKIDINGLCHPIQQTQELISPVCIAFLN
ncbi:lactonase family protein [Flavobacterium ovatum]|uniref:lactonase family protein n=1 Tax=Flavobacterium ovatum TaxID=1928857 RepID=UPI00344DF3B2